MVFACQQDSFLKTYTTKIKSCEKVNKDADESYEIICEDTILFPEGGGQPNDTGFLDDIPVYNVQRRGAEAIHYAKTPIPVGKEVKQSIDWERRFDHMQQHSGQHLITAIINRHYKIDTTAWWLGVDVCHIELDTKDLSAEKLSNIEKLSNEQIQAQIPVNIKICNPGDAALDGARTRGLPEDVSGPIRIIEIEGIEDDLCCGTHVTNLIQIQAVKLLYAAKGKKNKTNLFFIAGGRILKYLSKSLEREAKLTKLLKSSPEQHAELVEKLQTGVKITNKKLSIILKMYAADQAKEFLAQKPRPRFFFNYIKEADTDFIDAFLRTIKEDPTAIENTLYVLIVGVGSSGIVTVYGTEQLVNNFGPRIAELLDGKGITHGGRFQAKISKPSKAESVKKLLTSELFSNSKTQNSKLFKSFPHFSCK